MRNANYFISNNNTKRISRESILCEFNIQVEQEVSGNGEEEPYHLQVHLVPVRLIVRYEKTNNSSHGEQDSQGETWW